MERSLPKGSPDARFLAADTLMQIALQTGDRKLYELGQLKRQAAKRDGATIKLSSLAPENFFNPKEKKIIRPRQALRKSKAKTLAS